jgi:hypothetical protein
VPRPHRGACLESTRALTLRRVRLLWETCLSVRQPSKRTARTQGSREDALKGTKAASRLLTLPFLAVSIGD